MSAATFDHVELDQPVDTSSSPFDVIQLPSPLSFTQAEVSWYIFEGRGRDGRRIAVLVAVHRTGQRVRRIRLEPRLITGVDLPRPLRDLVPAWLPIWSPVSVDTDERPLVTVAVYDLDRGRQVPPIERECAVDLATFSARTPDRDIEICEYVAGRPAPPEVERFFAGSGRRTSIHARGPGFELALHARARKPAVTFGPAGPRIQHGRISTCYVQRPRLDVVGALVLDGERIESFVGDGVHDHQWMDVTTPNLKWMWPHLRFADGRELTGYVVRDSSAGRDADADAGRELARGGWLIERDGAVRPLRFDVRAAAHIDTVRGRVPTRFVVAVPDLDLRLVLDHVIAAPYLRMRAFGDVIDAGIYEGPIKLVESSRQLDANVHGWVEVMNAATARF